MKPDRVSRRLLKIGLGLVGLGLLVFLIGMRPDLLHLDFTPGIGLLQITVFLIGLTFITSGAYLGLYAIRRRGRPPTLRATVATRLMATGLVTAYAAGYADVLGIGSHPQHPLFGPLQALAVAASVVIIGIGLVLYSLP